MINLSNNIENYLTKPYLDKYLHSNDLIKIRILSKKFKQKEDQYYKIKDTFYSSLNLVDELSSKIHELFTQLQYIEGKLADYNLVKEQKLKEQNTFSLKNTYNNTINLFHQLMVSSSSEKKDIVEYQQTEEYKKEKTKQNILLEDIEKISRKILGLYIDNKFKVSTSKMIHQMLCDKNKTCILYLKKTEAIQKIKIISDKIDFIFPENLSLQENKIFLQNMITGYDLTNDSNFIVLPSSYIRLSLVYPIF